MNSPIRFWNRKNRHILIAGLAIFWMVGGLGFAQTIPNPSFEMDSFATYPGYISVNAPITGWVASDDARAGINPADGQSPFANNGAIPDGSQVAFIQSANPGPASLSTVMTDLTPGQVYTVKFRANGRDGQSPTLRIAVDEVTVLSVTVPSVGGSNPYRHVVFDFAASDVSHTLSLTNDTATGDHTLLVDDFSIAPSTTGWSYENWSDDATSGVDGSRTYTHAYNFGGSATTTDTVINGVMFTARTGTHPGLAYEYGLAGFGSQYGGSDDNAITAAGGGSANLMRQFVYGANPGSITIGGLVPGMEYVATLYSAGWEDGLRVMTFNVGDDYLTVNQDEFGNDQGIRISYHYVAPANGQLTINVAPFVANSTHHLYGFSNYEVTPQTTPVIGLQPQDLAGSIGAPATLSVTAGGARPLSFQWQKDGVDLPGQTSRVLTLASVTTGDLGQYTVVVSNGSGTETSSAATLSVGGIPNFSFEADTFLAWPGYINGNVPVSGWIASDPARVGINPLPGYAGPFANTGTVPDGTQAALMQYGGTPVTLSTLLTGLTPGENYFLNFRANGRNDNRPVVHVGADGALIGEFRLNPVGGASPYRPIALSFVPASDTVALTLTNDPGSGDHTALVDDFSLEMRTTQWAFAPWNDDASSGVDGARVYSHAFNFGGAAQTMDTTLNGVRFVGTAGANPTVPGVFTATGFTGVFGADDNNLITTGGGSADLASSFVYYSGTIPADIPQTLTIENLAPGVEYETTLYGVAFGPKGYGRSSTFTAGEDQLTINEHFYDDNNGIRVTYRYVADDTGVMTFTWWPTDRTSSFHTYGFSNCELVSTNPPYVYQQPESQTVAGGSDVILSAVVGGQLPLSFQWQKDGVDLPGENASILTLTGVDNSNAGIYTLVISNVHGEVTTTPAVVRVGVLLSGIYNTGVDDSGALLPGESVDPHYQLIQSADPSYPGPDATVLIEGLFPLAGNYLPTGPDSSWISPMVNTEGFPGNLEGLYVYRTTFILDTTDPATASLDGATAVDNYVVDILLNGVSTGIQNVGGFASFTPFAISDGFVAGLNTLDFVVSNAPPTGPTALRVQLKGVATPLVDVAPAIATQPQDLAVAEADDAEFAVIATGSGPLSYQWYYESPLLPGEVVDLPGETGRTLLLSSVAKEQEGSYSVVVSNPSGSVTSTVATLTVNLRPTPGPDLLATPEDSPLPVPGWKLLVNDSDPDGRPITLVGVSAQSVNGGTVTLADDVVTYTPPAGYAGDDLFSYTISNDLGAEASADVIVIVGFDYEIGVVSPPVLSDGQFTVQYSGLPGYTYTVSAAEDLDGPWTVLTNITADVNGLITLQETLDPVPAVRFYSIAYP